ncbi:hypothetical protein [Deinococcus sp.]|uniref:hypothetical protein n=1 Tax=Deinococcus sp. TaxID=47478 RepID=UPI0025F331E7|nr:hypothetical protein [Deinococcus sp.]
MTLPIPYERNPERDALRHSANRARAHVGAAGFQQSDALERLIQRGAVQSDVSDALEDLLDAALAAAPHHAGDKRALAELIRFGYAQLEAADRQRNLVNMALADLYAVPVRELSLGRIEELSESALAISPADLAAQRQRWEEVALRTQTLELPELQACLGAYRAALHAQASLSAG